MTGGGNINDENDEEVTYRITTGELRQFIERLERLDEEKKTLAEQKKEVMSEAKAHGYDTKVMKTIIALRKRKDHDIAELLHFPPQIARKP